MGSSMELALVQHIALRRAQTFARLRTPLVKPTIFHM